MYIELPWRCEEAIALGEWYRNVRRCQEDGEVQRVGVGTLACSPLTASGAETRHFQHPQNTRQRTSTNLHTAACAQPRSMPAKSRKAEMRLKVGLRVAA